MQTQVHLFTRLFAIENLPIVTKFVLYPFCIGFIKTRIVAFMLNHARNLTNCALCVDFSVCRAGKISSTAFKNVLLLVNTVSFFPNDNTNT